MRLTTHWYQNKIKKLQKMIHQVPNDYRYKNSQQSRSQAQHHIKLSKHYFLWKQHSTVSLDLLALLHRLVCQWTKLLEKAMSPSELSWQALCLWALIDISRNVQKNTHFLYLHHVFCSTHWEVGFICVSTAFSLILVHAQLWRVPLSHLSR